MGCKNFLKVYKSTGEKMFAKYLSTDGCFIKRVILLTMMIMIMLLPDTRVLAFTREPTNP